MTPRILILAGTVAQAAEYMRTENLSPATCAYVSGAHSVKGYLNPLYVVVGTFWDRHDALRIWADLKACMTDSGSMKAPPEIERYLKQSRIPKVITPVEDLVELEAEFKHIMTPVEATQGRGNMPFKRIKT